MRAAIATTQLPAALALLAALAPIAVVAGCLILGIRFGALPDCNPLLDGCVSISATGRAEPSLYLFKPAFTLHAVLLALLWAMSARWLALLSAATVGPLREPPRRETPPCASGLPKRRIAMLALGLLASLSLVLYVTVLGSDTHLYRFMRRFGIYGYFAGTVFAQLMLANIVIALAGMLRQSALRHAGRAMQILAAGPLALGILNLVLKQTLADPDAAENVIEWWAAAMMQAGWLPVAVAWRITRFSWRVDACVRP
ncbi:MAG: hypothetical protein R3E87_04890 [Burkholderiaceae bacterium]